MTGLLASAFVSHAAAGGGGDTTLYTVTYDTDAYDGLINEIGTEGGAVSFANPTLNADQAEASQSSNQDTTRIASKATDQGLNASTGCAHTQNVASSWWQIDFGVFRVRLDNFTQRNRDSGGLYPTDWKLQGSSNGTSWTDLVTVTGASSTASAWQTQTVANNTEWQYLRLLQTAVNSSSTNHLVIGDVEMWGDYIGPDLSDTGIVYATTYDTGSYDGLMAAIGTVGATDPFQNPDTGRGTVTTSSLNAIDANRTSDKALDHSLVHATDVYHSTNTASSWWKADFGASNKVRLDHAGLRASADGSILPRNWKWQGSNDDSSWTDLATISSSSVAASGWDVAAIADNTEWRYIRVLSNGTDSSGNNYLIIGDIELWGDYVTA